MADEIVWKIGGEAGYGILSTGFMFTQLMKDLGYYIFSKTDYPSLIRGGNNTYTVRASKKPLNSHTHEVDVLVCLDDNTFKKYQSQIKKGGILICDSSIKKNIRKDVFHYSVPFSKLANKYGVLKKVMMATIGVGVTASNLNIPKKIVKKLFTKRFKNKGEAVINQNLEAFNSGYNSVNNPYYKRKDKKLDLEATKTKNKKLILMNGNTAMALGAIRAGCKFMSSYPMTPATSIMQTISQHQESHNLFMHQAEDENAALNYALGASYAGARSLVATSGGGFALMTETLSLAGCSETPIVLIIASRPGPATGLPTRTEQGDLSFAVHAGHGDFQRIVLAPGDCNECFNMTLNAFNLADKYQMPVIILTDKYLAVSINTIPYFNTKYKIDRGEVVKKAPKLKPLEKFKRYKITKTGVSPRPFPGTPNTIQCTIGDEHDEEGYIVEDSKSRVEMMNKREMKTKLVRKELKGKSVKVHGAKNSKIVLLGWGSTKGAILESLNCLAVKFVQVKTITPFPAKELENKVGEYNKLILIENNSNGQLGKLVKEHTNLKITHEYLKYDGRPFNPVDIGNYVKGLSN